MMLNISNPIEAICFNTFALAQNFELPLMATWAHLSTYLLFIINFSTFEFFNTESSEAASVKHTDLNPPDRQKQSLEVFYRKSFS